MVQGYRWEMREPEQPLERVEVPTFEPGTGEVVVEVAACGLCHTDIGFLYDGVRPRHELPLTLGHEVSGRVVATAADTSTWNDALVVVPAVMPCGHCTACETGRGSICPHQRMPGNDIHGGFASHLIVPADGLCPVDGPCDESELRQLSVIADAISTPYQAVRRSDLQPGQVAVVVGLGGVGGFCAQIAKAQGAVVFGIEVDADRLARMTEFGVDLAVDPSAMTPRDLKKTVRAFAKERGLPQTCWRIFECSGTTAGQATAFSLLNHGAWLSIVGFTRDPVSVRLSNLMAFDATCEGNWGCLPELYPPVLKLVRDGSVKIGPFIQEFPMSEVNEVLAAARSHSLDRRPVLVP
ncbi:MAG: 6-hydroxycyclohex-1-ene-1-carbonyl-CoA dehydrogenase [Planctomycetes bacterium]|nr:6-hydroxycyclohex-1-ene-1-carbonyl-CoA dehydrogenase [Planctomycetota bacterium]